MKKTKKGFTLVELLVVIAILAILASVSVVGYIGFTKKAQVSNDIGIVTQLNTILKSNEALDGANKTMYDAVMDVKDSGYDVEKMTPTAEGYDILWDQNTDRFILLNGDEVVHKDGTEVSEKPYLWKVYNEIPEELNQVYSIYLSENKNITSISSLKVGFDCGNNRQIATINYTGELAKAIIRTQNSKLTVNNPNAVVSHYGLADEVDIIECASSSYYEYGTVSTKIKLQKGHLVLEENSSVNVLDIPETASEIVLEQKKNSKLDTVIATGTTLESLDLEQTTNKVNTTVSAEKAFVVLNKQTLFNTIDDALKSNEDLDILLLKDITLQSALYLTNTSQKNIDLNGFKLSGTFAGSTILKIENSKRFVLKNGKVDFNKSGDYYSMISASKNSNVILDNVYFTTNSDALMADDSASKLQVINSTVKAYGYCLATNGTNGSEKYVDISIIDSQLLCDYIDEDAAGTCAYVNIPCTLNIKGSYLEGYFHGLYVRGGTAVIENSHIINIMNDPWGIGYFDSSDWGQGQRVPLSALTLGNKLSVEGSYNYPTSVILKNTIIESAGTCGASNKDNSYPAIEANACFKNTVTLKIDKDSKIIGNIRVLNQDGVSILYN